MRKIKFKTDADAKIVELQEANDFLGMQLVEKDMQIFGLQNDNNTLGEQLVGIDIRLMMGGL